MRRTLSKVVASVLVASVALGACGGDDEPTGRRDPLSSDDPAPDDLTVVHTDGIVGLPGTEPDGPATVFGLFVGDGCLYAAVGRAYSSCQYLATDPSSVSFDGGLHDDVSVAWVAITDPAVTLARFWMLDGSTFEQSPVGEPGATEPAQVFGHAVPASNEIVGIELLDADGNVAWALSIDGGA
ncbi:MAG: hypothetical protein U0Q03_05895 [Acidimicrobiales bacterium]